MNAPYREPGAVRVRWLGDSGTELEFDRIRLDDALCQASRRWFPSNEAPDRMVMMVVVERDGEQMTDEEAEAYIRDQLAVKRAVRVHRSD